MKIFIKNRIALRIRERQQLQRVNNTLFQHLVKTLESPISLNEFINAYISLLKKLKVITIPTATELETKIKSKINIAATQLLKKPNFTERDLTKTLISTIQDFSLPYWDVYCKHVNNLFVFSKDVLMENINYDQLAEKAKKVHNVMKQYESQPINSLDDLAIIFVTASKQLDGTNYNVNAIVESLQQALNATKLANAFSSEIISNNQRFKESCVAVVKPYAQEGNLQNLHLADLEPLINDNKEVISNWLKKNIPSLKIKEDSSGILQYTGEFAFNPMLILHFLPKNRFIQKIRTKLQQLYRKLDANVKIIPVNEIPEHTDIAKGETFFISGLGREKRASALVDFNGELIGEPSDKSHHDIMLRVVNEEKRYDYSDVKAWLEDRGRVVIIIHPLASIDEIKEHCLNDPNHNFEKVIYYHPDDHSPDGSDLNKVVMAKRFDKRILQGRRHKFRTVRRRLLTCEPLIRTAALDETVYLYINKKYRSYTIQDVLNKVDENIIPREAIELLFSRANYFNQNSDRAEFAHRYLEQIVTNPTNTIFHHKIRILNVNLYPAQWRKLSGLNVFNKLFDRARNLEKDIETKLFTKFKTRIDRIIEKDPEVTTINGNVKLSELNPKENIRSLALLLILGSEINDDGNANPERYVAPYAADKKVISHGHRPKKIIVYHGQGYTYYSLAELINKLTGLDIKTLTLNSMYCDFVKRFQNLPEDEREKAINTAMSEYVDELLRKKHFRNDRKLLINGKMLSLAEASEQSGYAYSSLMRKKLAIHKKLRAEHPSWPDQQIFDEAAKELATEIEQIINKQKNKQTYKLFTINGIDYTIPQIAKHILKYDETSIHKKWRTLVKDLGEAQGSQEFARLVEQEIDQPNTTFLARGMRRNFQQRQSRSTITINGETKRLEDWDNDPRVKEYGLADKALARLYKADFYTRNKSKEEALQHVKEILQRMFDKRPALRIIPLKVNGTWQFKNKSDWIREFESFMILDIWNINLDELQLQLQDVIDKLYTNCTIDNTSKLIKDWLLLLHNARIDNYRLLCNSTIEEIQTYLIDKINNGSIQKTF